MKTLPDLLLVADSERDANMLYATRFVAPDAFVYFRRRGKTYLIASDLELDRARATAEVDHVLSHTTLHKKFGKPKTFANLVAATLRSFGARRVRVPTNFPLRLAERLRRDGVRVWTDDTPIFPERAIKTPDEIRAISKALRITETGLAVAIKELRRARIGRDGFLYRGKNKLTAESLRTTIHIAFTRLGGVGQHTIVAGGNQVCDCHESGYGAYRAHKTIVLDLFPRDSASGYWGDMTRTVVRGRASDAIKKIYASVEKAQQVGFDNVREGVDGKEVHKAVQESFQKDGYKTGRKNGRMYGFFHGTGHGLGLEVHDPLRMGVRGDKLRAGNVMTVEPGLYYYGIGGVRIEDVVLVTKTGNRLLSHFPRRLEI